MNLFTKMKALNDAFFGRSEVPVVGIEPYSPKPIIPILERMGVIPKCNLVAPSGSRVVEYEITASDSPNRCMRHVCSLPSHTGFWTMKEHVAMQAMGLGARYGFARFVDFH